MTGAIPQIDVVLAVHQPDMTALERQIDSVLAQEGCTVRLHLFTDGPMPQLEQIEALAGRLPEVTLNTFAENRGPATTFLEGLAHVLDHPGEHADERWFAFCDQDDVWHPRKLAASFARLQASGAACVHTDTRVTGADGNIIAASLFALERREVEPALLDLFFRNNATGMTMLFGASLAKQAAAMRHLRPHRWLHDQFTAFLAVAGRGLVFCDEPLADYVQHGGNMVGAGQPGIHWPRARFLDQHGDAAQLQRTGSRLVRELLAGAELGEAARSDLEQLRELLEARGVKSVPQALRTLYRARGVPRGIAARLLWSKLAG